MNFCPTCGLKLVDDIMDHKKVKRCECGYIDWDNWVNVSAVVVCFNERREFCMVRMKRNSYGKLTFPGGYRDLHETLEEAASREFYEETGYQITHLKLYKVYTKDDLRLVWIVYTAQLGEGHFLENSETEDMLFFSKNHIPNDDELRGSLSSQLLHDVLNEFYEVETK